MIGDKTNANFVLMFESKHDYSIGLFTIKEDGFTIDIFSRRIKKSELPDPNVLSFDLLKIQSKKTSAVEDVVVLSFKKIFVVLSLQSNDFKVEVKHNFLYPKIIMPKNRSVLYVWEKNGVTFDRLKITMNCSGSA